MAAGGTMRRRDCLFVNYGGAPIGPRCHNKATGAKDGGVNAAHTLITDATARVLQLRGSLLVCISPTAKQTF